MLAASRIFEATRANISDLGKEHGHRVLRVCGKGTKVVMIPLPPAVGRAIDRAINGRSTGPILLNTRGTRMDRHAATRRLRHPAHISGVRISRAHPHMLRHTFVTTMLDAGGDIRDVQIAARHADPRTTMRPRPRPPEPRPPLELRPRRLPGLRHMRSSGSPSPTLSRSVASLGHAAVLHGTPHAASTRQRPSAAIPSAWNRGIRFAAARYAASSLGSRTRMFARWALVWT